MFFNGNLITNLESEILCDYNEMNQSNMAYLISLLLLLRVGVIVVMIPTSCLLLIVNPA